MHVGPSPPQGCYRISDGLLGWFATLFVILLDCKAIDLGPVCSEGTVVLRVNWAFDDSDKGGMPCDLWRKEWVG